MILTFDVFCFLSFVLQQNDRIVINTADDDDSDDSDTAVETEYSYNDQLRKQQLCKFYVTNAFSNCLSCSKAHICYY